MKVQVILYGTLRNGFSGHDPTHGLEVELAEGSRVGDLVDQLEISRTRLGVVTVDGIPVLKSIGFSPWRNVSSPA